MMQLLRGGLYGTRKQPVHVPPYRFETNRHGVTFVFFRWSPTRNLYDCIMTLEEARQHGLIPGVMCAEARR